MKRNIFRKLIALTLTAIAILSCCIPVLATEEDYRERRPDFIPPFTPTWTEEQVECSSGGHRLSGTLTVPLSEEKEAFPMAILIHGLNTDREWCTDMAFYLADHGIASVRFDLYGNGKSDGEQWDMTVSTQIQDTMAILDYVESLAITDLDNIFLVGKSMGGVDSMIVAGSRQDEIKAVCLWYPAFGISDNCQHGFLLGRFFIPWFPPPFLESAGFVYSREFIKEAQCLDMQEICSDYQGPVLILHGDADFIAPLKFSFDMEPYFADCTLHIVPWGMHGFFGPTEIFSLEDMTNFLESHID